jgi:LL-diaminopimelate aminotransferase
VYLNYPNNPTTAVATTEYLQRVIAVCRRHDIVVAYDNPYCELTYDGFRAPSILEIPGASEIAVEFHSLSKSFSMTGWRLGWLAGNAQVIQALSKIKTYVDTGPFLALQYAGAAVLQQAEPLIKSAVAKFRERRDVGVAALRDVGCEIESPRATMYLWVPLPEGLASEHFARRVLEEEGVLVLAGSSFGRSGEGFFRIALTVQPERLRQAVQRIGRVLERHGSAGARA